MAMRGLFRKLVRGLAGTLAAALILLAMSAGVLRLVVVQLPSYRGEIWEWVQTELGFSMNFSRMDARWSLLGPEFRFRDPTVSPIGEADNSTLSALEATLAVSPVALITERRLEVNRLTLDGPVLRLERTADGNLRLANLPGEGNAQARLSAADIPPVNIAVNNGTIVYADDVTQREWAFDDVRLRLVREPDGIVVEGRARPRQGLAERVEVSARLDADGTPWGAGAEWRLFGEARDMDLSALADLFRESLPLSVSGAGDVSFWLDFAGGEARQATLALAMEELRLGADTAATGADYEQFDVTLEVGRLDGGWEISASNIDLNRQGRAWPAGGGIDVEIARDDDGLSALFLRGDFLRLEDLEPMLAALPSSGITELWPELRPRGDLRDVEARLVRGRDSWRYSAVGRFDGLGTDPRGAWPGLRGLSGEFRTDTSSGGLHLNTRQARLDWPVLFGEPLDVANLSGRVTWRQGASGWALSGRELVLDTPDGQSRSTLDLEWSDSGGAPYATLRSEVRNFDAAAAMRYFPLGVAPQVASYLDRAIVAGRVPEAQVTLDGPLDAFPFGNGEGLFNAEAIVEDGTMEYVENWPLAEDLNGVVAFTNVGWEGAGSGRVLGNRSEDLRVGIEDMRDPVISVTASTRGLLDDVLGYLRGAPLIARHLGPDLQRLRSAAGTADVDFELILPLLDHSSHQLRAGLEVAGGEMSIDGFGPALTGIHGGLRLENGDVSSRGRLMASFLDAPVLVGVGTADEPGYLAEIGFEGVFDAESIHSAFNLPFVEQVVGASGWRGQVMLPENRFVQARREPFRINLTTDLAGTELRFPEPLSKPPQQDAQLALEVVFSEADRLNVNGRLGEDRRFALSFRNRDGELSFRRGGIRFGGAEPLLPPRDGLSLNGELEVVDFDDWWTLFQRQVPMGSAAGLLLGAELEIVDLTALGQRLGPADVSIRQQAARWQLQVDSAPVAGTISWPLNLGDRPQVLAELERLHLSTEDLADSSPDPRRLPGVLARVEDFSAGTRRLGALEADIRADPDGLNIVALSGRTDSFALEGNGSWHQQPQGQETRLVLSASSEDVAGALEQLGFDPITEAESARLAANVYWPSGPTAGWEDSISGGFNLQLERGSILNLEPGAGRMVGLMSITALPRRLALDFREVFNRGLVFDELGGDFVIIDGDAYTDNLRLAGPVVDIGLVGRTGLRDRDYQQHAVVTSEPGRILPAVGFLAGPQVGAALLLFSEIFREPLTGVGRVSYCVTGSWSEPVVERLTDEELQQNRLCASLPQLAASLEP